MSSLEDCRDSGRVTCPEQIDQVPRPPFGNRLPAPIGAEPGSVGDKNPGERDNGRAKEDHRDQSDPPALRHGGHDGRDCEGDQQDNPEVVVRGKENPTTESRDHCIPRAW